MPSSNTRKINGGLTITNRLIKRTFDICVSSLGLVFIVWIIIPAWIIACFDTQNNVFFTQERVGQNGKIFKVIKLRTMRDIKGFETTVTTKKDSRITKLGQFWRRTKIDELPQLINVLKGDMNFVGPRPDVPGYADKLQGEDRSVLNVRPGITGPSSIKYKDEENKLAAQIDREKYNIEVIWPHKVRINKEYVKNYTFKKDLLYIVKTIFE